MTIIDHTPYREAKKEEYNSKKHSKIIEYELKSPDSINFMLSLTLGDDLEYLLKDITPTGDTLEDRVRDGKSQLFDKIVKLIKDNKIEL